MSVAPYRVMTRSGHIYNVFQQHAHNSAESLCLKYFSSVMNELKLKAACSLIFCVGSSE